MKALSTFQEEFGSLLVQDTKDVANKVLAMMVATHHQRGKEQFQSFTTDMENKEERTFHHPMKKDRVSLSSRLSKLPVVLRKKQ